MFLEPRNSPKPGRGWIEVICGSMFSGKTEELMRRIRRAQFARQKVEIFKPAVDTRYAVDKIVSHDETEMPSSIVENSAAILILAGDNMVVGIDEAQFFDNELPHVCETLAMQGKRVIVAGLDLDYRGIPFGPIPAMLAMAEYITKVHAICAVCGSLASHSYRKVSIDDKILLGTKDHYEPRCRFCFSQGANSG